MTAFDPALFANAASVFLSADVAAVDTAITLPPGYERFPVPTPGQFYMAVMEDVRSGAFEVVKVTGMTGSTVTMVRAQEGTLAQVFLAGSTFSLRATAGAFNLIKQALSTEEAARTAADAALNSRVDALDPGGDAGTFLGLTDTPTTYAGAFNWLVAVDPTSTGLVFVNPTSLSGVFLPKSGGTLSGPLQVPLGTVTAPGLQLGDVDSGLWCSAAGGVNIATNGVDRVQVNSAGLTVASGAIRSQSGSVSTPAFNINETATGLFRPATATIGFTLGGTEALRLTPTVAISALPVQLPADPTDNAHAASKHYVDAMVAAGGGAVAGKVSKTGDIMTGDLTISKVLPTLVLNKTGVSDIGIHGKNNDLFRWTINLGHGVAESGGNVGSDFSIARFDDGGNYLGSPLTIYRVNGTSVFGGDVQLTGPSPNFYLNKTSAGADAQIFGLSSGALRWTVDLAQGAASDFTISRYTDAGAYIDTPFLIARATGISTFRADVWLSKASPSLALNKSASGQSNAITGFTNGSGRWQIIPGDGTPESGANVGSNFYIHRYTDGGNYWDTPFGIDRQTGQSSIRADVARYDFQPNGYLRLNSQVGVFVAGDAATAPYNVTGMSVDAKWTTPFTFAAYHNPGVEARASINMSSVTFLFLATGIGYAPAAWTTGSDRRVKDDIVPIKNAMAKLGNLVGSLFTRIDMTKEDGTHPRMAGLIAQDVEMALPEAVSQIDAKPVAQVKGMEDDTPMRAYDPNAVLALVVNALKEVNARLVALEMKA